MKQPSVWALAIALILVAAVGCLLWLGLKRPPVAVGAESLASAIEGLDEETLYQFALPEERETGLTVSNLRSVLNGRPGIVIESLTPIGGRETSVNGSDAVNGATTRWYRTASGHRVELAVTADMAESRPMARVLLTTLLLAWRADAADHAAPMAELQYSAVMLAGIRKDRDFLTSIGLEGIWISPEAGFLTWDQLEVRYAARVEAQRANR